MMRREVLRCVSKGHPPLGVRCTVGHNATDSDFARYRREVVFAEAADEHRRRVDDTKKRAVYQAENYDQFKNLVATCHLRPLEHGELKKSFTTSLALNKAAKRQDMLSLAAFLPDQPVAHEGASSCISELPTEDELSLGVRCGYGIRNTCSHCSRSSAGEQSMRSSDFATPPDELCYRGNLKYPAALKRGLDAESYLRLCRDELGLSREESLRRLASLPSAVLQVMFKVELDSDLLLEMLETLFFRSCPRAPGVVDPGAGIPPGYHEKQDSSSTTVIVLPKREALGHQGGVAAWTSRRAASARPSGGLDKLETEHELTGSDAGCVGGDKEDVRDEVVKQEEEWTQQEAAEAASVLFNLSTIPAVRRALVLLSEEERQKVQQRVSAIVQRASKARSHVAYDSENSSTSGLSPSLETQISSIGACFNFCGRQEDTSLSMHS